MDAMFSCSFDFAQYKTEQSYRKSKIIGFFLLKLDIYNFHKS